MRNMKEKNGQNSLGREGEGDSMIGFGTVLLLSYPGGSFPAVPCVNMVFKRPAACMHYGITVLLYEPQINKHKSYES